MSIPSDAPQYAPVEPAPMLPVRPLYWSMWREVWENRYLYIAPLIVAGFVLLGSFISLFRMAHRIQALPANDPGRLHIVVVTPFSGAPAPIILVSFMVGMFYSLDAMYGERRDRSILFWKSMPVSDVTAVMAKFCIPMLVMPVIGFLIGESVQLILLMISSPILAGHRLNPAIVWQEFHFFQEPLIMIYGLIIFVLWWAPLFSWLLLVSAWARRATILWALMPLLAVSALERILFNTWTFMHMLQYRVGGALKEGFAFAPKHDAGGGLIDELSQLDPVKFLTRPGLWLGLMFAAAFLVAAVRLRRYREPI
jgi:ABC-2 type transport system permease protein